MAVDVEQSVAFIVPAGLPSTDASIDSANAADGNGLFADASIRRFFEVCVDATKDAHRSGPEEDVSLRRSKS